ncbi:PIG-L deacetylase family protein [Planctomycetota bacterium]
MIRGLKNAVKEARATWRRASIARRLPIRPVSAEAAVVVAPHPDDETFGAGGMIALKRALNVPVTVILLTDGEASLAAFPAISPEEVGQVRRNQAAAATGSLGLDPGDVSGLGLVDGKIPHPGQPGFEDAVVRLARELDHLAPSELYCPHPHDGLPDHEAATSIVLAAARRSSRPFQIIFYVVWVWFNARSPLRRHLDIHTGWRLDVRSVYLKKRAAISHYLDGQRAGGVHSYCGYLPSAVTRSAKARTEIFLNRITAEL